MSPPVGVLFAKISSGCIVKKSIKVEPPIMSAEITCWALQLLIGLILTILKL
jgi:hypothetical protein